MMSGFNYETRMDLIQRYIDQGKAYRSFKKVTVPGNGTKDLSMLSGEDAIVLYFRSLTTSSPDIEYEVRNGATGFSYEGDPITIFRMNPKAGNASKNIFRECSVTGDGVLSDIDWVPGQAASGSNKSGDVYGGLDDIKVISENENNLLRFINPNSSDATVLLYLKWLEVPSGIWD
jgi:hypothetical protein